MASKMTSTLVSTMMEPAPAVPLLDNLTEKLCLSHSSSLSPLPSPLTCGSPDDKMRDSAICIDDGFCGVLEHTTVDDEEDSDLDPSSLIDSSDEEESESDSPQGVQPHPSYETLRDFYMSLNSSSSSLASSNERDNVQTLVTIPRRPFSAPAGTLLDAAIHEGPAVGPSTFYYDDADYLAAAVSLIQPAFPQVFDIFDYGDGVTYYLGGGGARITRHLSQRRRRGAGRVHNFWPFENPPLYMYQLHDKATGLPPIILYGGLDPVRDSAWADVQFSSPRVLNPVRVLKSLLAGEITVGLPPHRTAWQPLSGVDAPQTPDGRTEEMLHVHRGWHRRYRFEVEVEENTGGLGRLTNTPPRREMFEWRYCSGAELEALEEPHTENEESDEEEQLPMSRRRLAMVTDKAGKAGQFLKQTLTLRRGRSKDTSASSDISSEKPRPPKSSKPRWKSGWQLVRLAEAPQNPLAEAIRTVDSSSTTPRLSSTASTLFLDQLIGEEAGRAAERRRTPDGREIVAVWANAADDNSFSTSVVARFTFLGSGKDGRLGERLSLMAVASGLAVWERERRTRRRRERTVVQACGGLANIGA
ncbi:hypothetical protein SEUCBS140593_006800 [Sporothrix eucalyptigena]|uniref:Uncharacterized protein n=1 Tax=Sporothrix eucalyptigena TaxID=1812306 RepID=A0ABP0CAD3_9PEZI